MLNDPLQRLIQSLSPRTAAPGSPDSRAEANAPSTSAFTALGAQIDELRSVLKSQADVTALNTQAVTSHTAGDSGEAVVSALQTAAKSVLGGISGGLLLNPIIGGLMKLFGGGADQPAPTPVKYSLPPAIQLNAGISSTTGLTAADYGQNGLPRPITPPPVTQVTVQVNAMDSRSFLDRSDDIAQAVRRAMLESSSLNDVVSEL